MAAAKTHISLNVRDIARSTQFYSSFFGVSPHKERPGYANFDLEDPPLKLALNEYSDELGRGTLNHLGILVDSVEKVVAAKERLEKDALVSFTEENVLCCYARQDKVWVHDPDGNAWEVYTITDNLMEGVHEEPPRETACCAPTCCA